MQSPEVNPEIPQVDAQRRQSKRLQIDLVNPVTLEPDQITLDSEHMHIVFTRSTRGRDVSFAGYIAFHAPDVARELGIWRRKPRLGSVRRLGNLTPMEREEVTKGFAGEPNGLVEPPGTRRTYEHMRRIEDAIHDRKISILE
jgi:hypothetical protein